MRGTVGRPAAVTLLAWILLLAVAPAALAQPRSAEQLADDALARPASQEAIEQELSIPLLELLFRGGWLMVPIGLVSLVVVAIGVERTMALRRRHVVPKPLAAGLQEMAACNAFDPRDAFHLCRQYPSSAARVVHATLLRMGRPLTEIEHTVTEACQRESDSLSTNVRTLNLAVSVAPLLGLLGTVSGMIQAFFVTANMPLGSNRAQVLSEGIYIALVTTFAGLSVAIPASVLVHMFETRILRLLQEIEELLGRLLPQLERYEGKLRRDDRHWDAGGPTAALPSMHPKTKAS